MGHGKIKIGQAAFSASQIGTLYGCGWATMLELYNKYKGIDEVLREPTDEAKESMAMGTFFEDTIARYAAQKLGVKIKKCGETAYWADDMPYFICHPDRLIMGLDKKGRRAAMEVKFVSPHAKGWGDEWTDQVPDYYLLQCQSYFANDVPCDVVYLVCLRGNRIYIYEILPDWQLIADIRDRVRSTKEQFDAGIVPESEKYEIAVSRYGTKVNKDADAVGADEAALEIYQELASNHRKLSEAKAKEDELKAKIADIIKTAPALVGVKNGELCRLAAWSYKTTNGYDMARLVAEHPEVKLDNYKTSKKSAYISVNYEEAV